MYFFLGQALAFDADVGGNGEVAYSLIVSGSSPPFNIDSKTGEIRTTSEIL